MGSLSCLRSFHRQLASAGCATQSGAVFVGASVPGADVSLRAYRVAVVCHSGGARIPREGLAWASGRCHVTWAWGKGALQVPRLPPDFLSGLVVSVDFMRLSSKKAAYVAVDESRVVGNPEFARDDKVGDGDFCLK